MFFVCQGACPSSQIEITIIRDTLDYASNEIFGLFDYETDENAYLSWYPTDNSVETRTVCIPRVNSMLYSLMIANETDSWNPCSGLEILGPYGNRLFKRTSVGSVFLLSLVMPIDKNAEWEWTTNYNSDWLSSNVSGWDRGIPSSLPESDNTYYFRKSIQGMGFVSAYEFRILYRYGIVAYINGVEVYRDNMPDGAITPETRCSKTYGTYDYRGTIRNGFEVAANSVFSVEVHVTGSTSLQFDAWMAYYADTYSSAWPTYCYFVPVSQAVTSASENAAIYVDGSLCTGSYHTISIDVTYVEYTTQTAQVNSWNINGDQNEAMSQFKVVNQPLSNTTWSTTTYSDEFAMTYGILEQIPIGNYYSDNANKYRFYPTKLLTNPIIIADLMPSVCYQEYTLSRPNPPTYETSYLGKVGDSIELVPESSDSLQCGVSPALPSGLALTGCTIRGTPLESISTTVFTVFYYDRAGTRSVELSLTIDPLPEKKNMTWLIILIVVVVIVIVAVIIVLLKKNNSKKPKIPRSPTPKIVKPIPVDAGGVEVPMKTSDIILSPPLVTTAAAPAPQPAVVPVSPAAPAPQPAIVPITAAAPQPAVVPITAPQPAVVPITAAAPQPAVVPATESTISSSSSLIVALPSGDIVDLYTLPEDQRKQIMSEMGIV